MFNCKLFLAVCSINLLEDGLAKKDTKYRQMVEESLRNPILPKITFQFKWEPPSGDICSSSVGKFFSDHEVVVCPTEIKIRDELSRRLASFSNMESSEEVLEYLGILSLNCTDTSDDFLTSYNYPGDMTRVRNVKVIQSKGFFTPTDLQTVIDNSM